MERFEHWINGVETKPQGGQYLTSTNPAGGEMVSEIPRGTAADVDAAAIGAAAGQVAWAAMPLVDRARTLTRLAELIRTSADELVSWESAETAKPLQTAQGEIHACADYFEYYGALTRSLHGQTVEVGDDRHIFVRREPFGVVGVIMPWNGPLILAARSVAPALAAGNAVVLKPSEFTSVSSLIFGRLASSAGLPVGALQVITGTGPEAGAALTEHPKVRRLAFTGSVRAGREVA